MTEYKCNICNKNFKTDKTLNVHTNKYHPIEPVNVDPVNVEPVNVEPINVEPVNVDPINSQEIVKTKKNINKIKESIKKTEENIKKTEERIKKRKEKLEKLKPKMNEHELANYNDNTIVTNTVNETVTNNDINILNFYGILKIITNEQRLDILRHIKNNDKESLKKTIIDIFNE